jgi:hypothetical protein
VSADASPLADALALAFGHGPLAGIAPALSAEREGSAFRVRACWSVADASVAVEARGATLDACHEKIARQLLRLWPALEEAAEWL